MTIDELVSKYHWAQIGDDGVLELFFDHHSLSTFRMCEAMYDLAILKSYRGSGQLPWSLAFGTAFHKMVEYIYDEKQKGTYNQQSMMDQVVSEWNKNKLGEYDYHKTYQSLGGLSGFIILMSQYSHFYSNDNERLRPIGVELAFGKGKEVFLGEITLKKYLPPEATFAKSGWDTSVCRCYLSGRIDFLMDSGTAIGPMDHKTKAFFKGNPAEDHDPQEGMTGYVFAANQILKLKFPELLEKRKVDRIWMNYVQVKAEADFNKRFKRIPIFKTDWQLEQFRLRQLSTISKIVEFILSDRVPDWNTNICSNVFHQDCQFKEVHKKNSEADMFRVLNNDFHVAQEWNSDTIEERDADNKTSV